MVGYGVYVLADPQRCRSRRRDARSRPAIGALRRAQRRRAVRRDRVRAAARRCSTPPNGTPLYAPFHLAQTIPAMALAHLTVAGVVELALTAGVIALPAAREPAAAADQPSATCRVPTAVGPASPRPVSAGGGRSSALGAMVGAHAARAARARAARSARTSPADLDLRQVPPRRGAARSRSATPASGTTRCSTATTSRTTRIRPSATSCRRSSASLVIAVGAARRLRASPRRVGARVRGRGRSRHDRRRRDWLLAAQARPLPVRLHRQAPEGRTSSTKTIGGAASTLRQAMFADDIAGRRRAAAAPRPAGEARRAASGCSSAPRSSAAPSVLVGARTLATLVLAAASRLSLRVLRQAGLAVRPDLHRHRRAARDAQLHHARPHRRAARRLVRHAGRAHAPGPDARGAARPAGRDLDLARGAAHAHDAVDERCSPRCARCSSRACSCSCSA